MEALTEIIRISSLIIQCSSQGLECLLVIFLISQYFKKKTNFKSAYFVILNIGYIFDVILFWSWIISMSSLIPYTSTLWSFFSSMQEWYIMFFITIWNVILCLNRCTALIFYFKYDKIWNRYSMFFIIIFMIAFPFIVDGISLWSSKCSLQTPFYCYFYRKPFIIKASIINGATMIALVIIITVSLYISNKKNAFPTSSNNSNNGSLSIHAITERRLIYQAIFSTWFLLICFALKLASVLIFDFNLIMIFGNLFIAIYHCHHLIVMILHFALSPSFKIAFLRFYCLGFLLRKSKTTTIPAASSRHLHTTTKVSTPRITVSAIH